MLVLLLGYAVVGGGGGNGGDAQVLGALEGRSATPHAIHAARLESITVSVVSSLRDASVVLTIRYRSGPVVRNSSTNGAGLSFVTSTSGASATTSW